VRPAATVFTAAQYSMNNWNFSTFSSCDVDRIFPLTVGDFLLRVSILTVWRSSSTSVFRIGALVTVARLYLFCHATSDVTVTLLLEDYLDSTASRVPMSLSYVIGYWFYL
jgi:hypothetical protein